MPIPPGSRGTGKPENKVPTNLAQTQRASPEGCFFGIYFLILAIITVYVAGRDGKVLYLLLPLLFLVLLLLLYLPLKVKGVYSRQGGVGKLAFGFACWDQCPPDFGRGFPRENGREKGLV